MSNDLTYVELSTESYMQGLVQQIELQSNLCN